MNAKINNFVKGMIETSNFTFEDEIIIFLKKKYPDVKTGVLANMSQNIVRIIAIFALVIAVVCHYFIGQ